MTYLLHLGTSNNFEALLFFVCLVFFLYFMRSVSVQVRYDENLVPKQTWERGWDGEGNGHVKKSIRLVWQNNNSARASRFFVHFLCRPNTTMT